MKVIDCHGHYMPHRLMEAFRELPFARSTSFLWNDPALSDLDHHVKVMDSLGVDAMVLVPSIILIESIRAAGVTSEEGMRIVDDAHAEAMRTHPGRFIGTVALDPFSGKAGLSEIERGVTKLGLKAISIKASYDGLYVDDEQFWPIYRLAQELRVPVMVHPANITPYWKEMQRSKTTLLRSEISMLLDTTICIGRFVRYGIYDKFPEVDFLFCKLGGMIPMLFRQFELTKYLYTHAPKEAVIGEAISFPVKSLRDYPGRIFGDTHAMDRVGIACAAENLGEDCIIYGGDYPISPWEEGMAADLQEVKETRLSASAREKILGGNAVRIFGLEG